MRQLQFFTTAELAKMRDRTASRSYSPAAEEFRREHERHREWGLKRRHANRLRHLRDISRDQPGEGPAGDSQARVRPVPPAAAAAVPRAVPTAVAAEVPAAPTPVPVPVPV